MDKKLNDLKALLKMFCESESTHLSTELKGFWLSQLMQEDIKAVKQACDNIMTGKHKVYGKITLKNITEQIRGNTEQDAHRKKEQTDNQAEDAYIEFRRCIRSKSRYSNFSHKDKVLIACIADFGGLDVLTYKNSKDLDFMKRNFIERYKQNLQSDDVKTQDKCLGFAEQQNNRRINKGAVHINSVKVV